MKDPAMTMTSSIKNTAPGAQCVREEAGNKGRRDSGGKWRWSTSSEPALLSRRDVPCFVRLERKQQYK